MKKSFANYAEFWPFYLAQHSKPANRWTHALGLVIALPIGVYSFATLNWMLTVAALGIGYGFAWFGHLVFEKNIPATFGHPFWSFYSDFRMVALLFAGKLPKDPGV